MPLFDALRGTGPGRDTASQRSFVSGALFVAFVALGFWELWMLADKVPGDTISAVVRRANVDMGGLPALFMIALWLHFFIAWPGTWYTGTPGAGKQ